MSTTELRATPNPAGSENPLVQEISLDRIKPSKANPRRRTDGMALNELAENIKSHGVLQPILIRPVNSDGYEIVRRAWPPSIQPMARCPSTMALRRLGVARLRM